MQRRQSAPSVGPNNNNNELNILRKNVVNDNNNNQRLEEEEEKQQVNSQAIQIESEISRTCLQMGTP